MFSIIFENVRKYFADVVAIDNVSFTVGRGEFTALAGPSGAGKTTILNVASGLDTRFFGRVTLLGHDLSRLTAHEITLLRRDHVGFVFQSYNLLPVLTVAENVEYPLALRAVPAKERRCRAKALLAEVGLSDHIHKRPSELSGGQQQRTAVARALIVSPEIIFADEPTANLDSRSADRLLELFEDLNTRLGITFVFSSHDPRVLRRARRILTVIDGTLHETPPNIRMAPTRGVVPLGH